MTRIIYADLLFIINLFSDFFIIYLTGQFSGTGCSFGRLVLSSFIGALSGTAILCLDASGPGTVLFILLIPPLLCITAFKKRSIRALADIIVYFFFSSVILYGGVYAMASVISVFFGKAAVRERFIFTLLLIAAVFFVYILYSSFFTRGLKRKEKRVTAELNDGHRKYDLELLVDSGNLAKDPFSAKPVVIVRGSSLDKELIDALSHSFEEGYERIVSYKHIRPRVIPMKTVSGTALLYAFIPESMFILIDKKRIRADCIIAIDNHENSFFGKDGIIPETLLQTL